MTSRWTADGKLRLERWADIPGAISALQMIGGSALLRVPVVQALYRGEIAFLDVQRSTSNRLVKEFLAIARKPAIVILGDDVEEPVGPAGITSTERLMRWARRIVIHGTGGEAWHYQEAVTVARDVRKLLLIECQSKMIRDYQAAADRWGRAAFVQTIRPLHGLSHPVPADKASLQ